MCEGVMTLEKVAMVNVCMPLLLCLLVSGWSRSQGEEATLDPRESCEAWMRGVPGTPGSHGPPGRQGREGRPGEAGQSGGRGVKGDRGDPGGSGDGGSRGPRGFPGVQGKAGPAGEDPFSYRSAFSMGLTASTTAVDTPIIFTKVLYNEQRHYDDVSGKFRCFTPGLYYFTFHMTVQGRGVRVGLYLNGRVVTLTLDQYQASDLDQASGGAVLSLTHGDQVWLQVYGAAAAAAGGGGIYADVNNDSTFTGFLLQPHASLWS
ncbi:adiponectin [Genypterus blacodes]|uniref:adiponectin n=1 Tax=Genypterus blacodes TaxID=154954 RepID=UPI003F76B8D5